MSFLRSRFDGRTDLIHGDGTDNSDTDTPLICLPFLSWCRRSCRLTVAPRLLRGRGVGCHS